jgi:hypothetical protein
MLIVKMTGSQHWMVRPRARFVNSKAAHLLLLPERTLVRDSQFWSTCIDMLA